MPVVRDNNTPFLPLNPPWRHGGFTLTEVVIALALVALVLAGALKGVEIMNNSSQINSAVSKFTQIAHGINEYRLLYRTIPSGSAWTPFNDFVDASIRAEHSYSCGGGTSNKVAIVTTYKFNANPRQKLIDQGVCSSLSHPYADGTFACYLSVFANDSCI